MRTSRSPNRIASQPTINAVSMPRPPARNGEYPANSPQAAARIVALTVVADGDIGDAETQWLDRLAVHEQLGLARHELHALLDIFCE